MGADPDGGAGKQIGAAKLGARYAILVGDAEAGARRATLKDLDGGEQETWPRTTSCAACRRRRLRSFQGESVRGDATSVR